SQIDALNCRMPDPDIDCLVAFELPRRMIDGDRHDGKDAKQHAALHRDEQSAERDGEHSGQKPAALVPEDGEGVTRAHQWPVYQRRRGNSKSEIRNKFKTWNSNVPNSAVAGFGFQYLNLFR